MRSLLMKKVRYAIPVNDKDGEDGTVTMEVLEITGSRKKRRKLFGKFLKHKYGLTNPTAIAKGMGFRDLL